MSRKVIVLKFGSSVLHSRAELPTRRPRNLSLDSPPVSRRRRRLGLRRRDRSPAGNRRRISRRQSRSHRARRRHRRGSCDVRSSRSNSTASAFPRKSSIPARSSSSPKPHSNDTEPVSADIRCHRERLQARPRRCHSRLRRARSPRPRCPLRSRRLRPLRALPRQAARARAAASSKTSTASTTAIPPPAPTRSVSTRSTSPTRSPSAARSFSRKPSPSDARPASRSKSPPSATTYATVVGSHHSVLVASRHFFAGAAEDRPARTRHRRPRRLSGAGEASRISSKSPASPCAVLSCTAITLPSNLLTRDCWDAIDDVDVVVELIGGTDPAGELVKAALAAGKPVVTANKLLLAERCSARATITRCATPRPWAAQSRRWKRCAPWPTTADRLALRRAERNLQLHPRSHRRRMLLVARPSPKRRPTASPSRIPAPMSPAPTRSCKLRLLARRAFPGRHSALRQRHRHRRHRSSPGCSQRLATADARDWSAPRRCTTAAVHLEVKPHTGRLVVIPSRKSATKKIACSSIMSWPRRSAQHFWTGRGAGRWPTTAAVMADLFDLSRELASREPVLIKSERSNRSHLP